MFPVTAVKAQCNASLMIAAILRTLIAGVFFLFYAAIPASGQMRQMYLDQQEASILNLSFYSPSEGYVAFSPYIGYTTDSGRTFLKKYITYQNVDLNGNQVDMSTGFGINGVRAINRQELIVYGHYNYFSAILHSGDGGNTFKLVYYNGANATNSIESLQLAPNYNGFAIDREKLLTSTDRGRTWTTLASFSAGKRYWLSVIDNLHIYVYTGNEILKTVNGRDFSSLAMPPGQILAFSFISDMKGWVYTLGDFDRKIYNTTDGGTSWKLRNTRNEFDSLYFFNMKFSDGATGYATGRAFKLYKSVDSGTTWLRLPRTNAYTNSVDWHSDIQIMGQQLWASGYSLLEMSTNGGGTPMYESIFNTFTPASGKAGDTITLDGSDFTVVNAVRFGGVPAASFKVVSRNTIKAVVGIGSSGDIEIETPVNTVLVKGFVAYPTITAVSPSKGTAGTRVVIKGTCFSDVTQVLVGGVAVKSFTINSPTSITTDIPFTTAGDITLIAPGRNATNNSFNYYPAPVIEAVTPLAAPTGSTVTITGKYFSTTAAENTVYFGAVKANVTAASSTSLSVTVPVGATFSPISVTYRSLTAYSPLHFTVTFPNGGSINRTSFAPPVNFNAGGKIVQPDNVVVSDLDGDGKPDLITPNITGGYLTISRNISTPGHLNFSENGNYVIGKSAGTVPLLVIAKDMNGDGKPDVVARNESENTITIFQNTSVPGRISFADRRDLPGKLITISDVNADGRPDLILTENDRLAYHRNYGEPDSLMFDPVEPLDWGNNFPFSHDIIDYYPHAYISSDIDGDNLQEHIRINFETGKIIAARYSGQDAHLATIESVEQIALGDLDGDGKPDMAVAQSVARQITILKNASIPGNILFNNKSNIALPGGAGFVTLADLDGDGKSDLITADEVNNSLLLFLNQSSPKPYIATALPTFGKPGDTILLNGSGFSQVTKATLGTQPVQSFRIVNDNEMKIVLGEGAPGDIVVTNNYGSATLKGFMFGHPPVINSISPISGPVGTTVTIKGNNFSETAAANIVNFGGIRATVLSASSNTITVKVPLGASYQPLTVTVNKRTGASGEIFVTTYPGDKENFHPASFGVSLHLSDNPNARTIHFSGQRSGAAVDLDGDGKQDIISHNETNLLIFKNASSSGKMIFTNDLIIPVAGELYDPVAGDMDGDGKSDIIILSQKNNAIYLFKNTSTPGNISFAAPHVISARLVSNTQVCDFDGDGMLDLIQQTDLGVTIYRNTSTIDGFAFDDKTTLLMIRSIASSISIADFNRDGKTDIIGGSTIYYNTSTPGKISVLYEYPPGSPPFPCYWVTGDWDMDGYPDLALLNYYESFSGVYRYSDDPAAEQAGLHYNYFKYAQELVLNKRPVDGQLGDLDGDGMPDLVTSSDFGNMAGITRNISSKGKIEVAPMVKINTGLDMSRATLIRDFDGDMKPDLAFFGEAGGITICRNQMNESVAIDICANSDTSLTASITGNSYQWQENNGSGYQPITADSIFSEVNSKTLHLTRVPAQKNGYTYRCLVDGNPDNATALQVIPTVIPAVRITTQSGSGTFCLGAAVTLNAIAENGGTAPKYEWWIDNTIKADTDSSVFVCDTFLVHHEVTAKMISSAVCPTKSIVASEPYQVLIFQPQLPAIEIKTPTNIICTKHDNKSYTFSVTITNMRNGYNHVWFYNNTPLTSGTDLTLSDLKAGDKIMAVLYTQDVTCIPARIDTSNIITMEADPTGKSTGKLSSVAMNACFPTSPRITFNSINADLTSEIVLWESTDNAAFIPKDTATLNNSSLSFVLPRLDSNAVKKYYCTITAPADGCLNNGISDTITIQYYQRLAPFIIQQNEALIIANPKTLEQYTWQIMQRDTSWQDIAPPATGTSFTPTISGNYRAVAKLGSCSSASNSIIINTDTTARVAINSYPNPVNDVFVLDKLKPEDNWQTLDIINTSGDVHLPTIHINGQTRVSVNTTSLRPGIYLAALRSSSRSPVSVRFIKM